MAQLTTDALYRVFDQVSTETKIEYLQTRSLDEVLLLYSCVAEFIDAIMKIEFSLDLNQKHEYVRHLLRQLHCTGAGSMTESAFIRDLLYAAIPVLYYTEKVLEKKTVIPVTDEQFFDFFVVFASENLQHVDSSRRISLKTCELKRYSKTRIELEETDRHDIGDDRESFVIHRACVFKVNRLQVLCGFFSEVGTWRSERHLDDGLLNPLLEKYQLVARK